MKTIFMGTPEGAWWWREGEGRRGHFQHAFGGDEPMNIEVVYLSLLVIHCSAANRYSVKDVRKWLLDRRKDREGGMKGQESGKRMEMCSLNTISRTIAVSFVKGH